MKGHVITGRENALLVPQRATTRQPDGSLSVYVVNQNNEVEGRTLEIGKIYRDQYVALSGVSEGEKVIVTGYQKVKPGFLYRQARVCMGAGNYHNDGGCVGNYLTPH